MREAARTSGGLNRSMPLIPPSPIISSRSHGQKAKKNLGFSGSAPIPHIVCRDPVQGEDFIQVEVWNEMASDLPNIDAVLHLNCQAAAIASPAPQRAAIIVGAGNLVVVNQTTMSSNRGQRSEERSRNIYELASSMKKELDYYWSLDEAPDTQTDICLIHKVQQHIRKVSRFSYEPIMLSIGPYHHGAASCQAIEKTKWGYLSEVVRINCEKKLLDYLNAVGALVSQARRCYSEQIKMGNESFIQMLLLDGCTILVALGGTVELRAQIQSSAVSSDVDEITVDGENEKLKQNKEEVTTTEHANNSQESEHNREMEDKEPEQSGLWFIRFVNHDLLLLENQIPFFIVKKLYELVAGKNAPTELLTVAMAKYVESALRCYPIAIKDFDRPKDFQHLLHLCHMYFRPSQKPVEEHHYEVGPQYLRRFLSIGRRYIKLGQDHHYHDRNGHSTEQIEYLEAGQQLNRWRRVAQYIQTGVLFRKRDFDKLNPHSLLDVSFTRSALEVPCLMIDEHTEFLFRNLIAFEQTCPQVGDDFTAYSVFLSQLISMPEDVALLAKKGILVHQLDSDETVSDLFTMLSKDVVFDFSGNYYLKLLHQTMEAHYQNRLNRWMAWLWFNHFSNPWLVLAALATVVVLVCTIVQTVYGILAYLYPPGPPNS